MDRIKTIVPAYDKRDPDPEKNYGIHGVEIRMVLKGPHGAVQFVVYTQRQLRHVQEEILWRVRTANPQLSLRDAEQIMAYSDNFTEGKEIEELIEWTRFVNKLELDELECLLRPLPADVGYHSPVPLYEGQEPVRHTLVNMKFESGELVPPVYGDPVICPYLDGDVPCYYEGSGLAAREVFKILVNKGEEAVWKELEDLYEMTFGLKK